MMARKIVPSGQEEGGGAEPAAAACTGDGQGDARSQFAQVPTGLTLSGSRPGCSAHCPVPPTDLAWQAALARKSPPS